MLSEKMVLRSLDTIGRQADIFGSGTLAAVSQHGCWCL